jgi:hypothetical protein
MKVPAWPSGFVSFDGEVFEYGAGEQTRVAANALKSVEIVPPKKGRLSLKFAYTAGLDNVKTGVWIEERHAADLEELRAAVQAAIDGG